MGFSTSTCSLYGAKASIILITSSGDFEKGGQIVPPNYRTSLCVGVSTFYTGAYRGEKCGELLLSGAISWGTGYVVSLVPEPFDHSLHKCRLTETLAKLVRHLFSPFASGALTHPFFVVRRCLVLVPLFAAIQSRFARGVVCAGGTNKQKKRRL